MAPAVVDVVVLCRPLTVLVTATNTTTTTTTATTTTAAAAATTATTTTRRVFISVYHHQPGVSDVSGAGCRRCSGTLSSIDRASDCSSSLSTSSNAVFATTSQLLVSKDDLRSKEDLRRCFSGEQIGTTESADRLNNSDN